MALRIVPEGGFRPLGLKTARPDRTRKPKRERGRQEDPDHLALIRKLPSLLGGEGKVEAAHVRMSDAAYGKGNSGVGQKPDDCWTVPLASDKHREQTNRGERLFWEEHGINPVPICQRLYGVSSALRASKEPEDVIVRHMTAIVMKARAEAGI
jgi:hypothetical protein